MTFLVLSTQDLSYYCCIELQGEEDHLLASLSQLTSKEAGENSPFNNSAYICLCSDKGLQNRNVDS